MGKYEKIVLIFAILFSMLAVFVSAFQFFHPLNQQNKKAIESTLGEFLEDKVFDLAWKKTFHWITFFESLDGFDVAANSKSIDHSGVSITTSNTAGNEAYLKKQPTFQGLITFSQKSYMRTAFVISSVSDVTAYMLVGDTTSGSYYGFKVVGNSLKGVSYDGIAESETDLQTIVASTPYGIEARYYPGDEIVFLVNSKEKGRITQNLPSAAEEANILPLHFSIKTTAFAAKTLQFSFWEYLQKRNILP